MYWAEFITIAIAHLFAVASPGPDFAIVLKQSVRGGTSLGVWTSAGVGAGILVHVTYCLLGVALVLSQSPVLFQWTKIIAGIYLLFLGIRSIQDSFAARVVNDTAPGDLSTQFGRAFVTGFLTNGLNPKATLFFLALFTVVIAPTTPALVQVGYGFYLALATFAWFAVLSLLLSRQSVRGFFQRSGAWFERGMGIVLILLALQIGFTV